MTHQPIVIGCSVLAGVIVLVGIQWVQFGVIYPKVYGRQSLVDPNSCKCDCWDTLFKGYYEFVKLESTIYKKYFHIFF